jgi:putative endonuclease
MAAKDELGRRGEDLAARYLERQGLVILSRNWRCRHGEIDLVATDSARLVVCEVKTRSTTRYGEPAEAVDARKVHRIRLVTNAWLQAHGVRWVPVRFDVLAVVAEPGAPVTVQHYAGAF